jgi:hypothetical protein
VNSAEQYFENFYGVSSKVSLFGIRAVSTDLIKEGLRGSVKGIPVEAINLLELQHHFTGRFVCR